MASRLAVAWSNLAHGTPTSSIDMILAHLLITEAGIAAAQGVGRLDQIAPRVAHGHRDHQRQLEEAADEDDRELLGLADGRRLDPGGLRLDEDVVHGGLVALLEGVHELVPELGPERGVER